MIKKVSSWVLGSFFRQFGRFLFFLVLGGLVFLLIQHNDINFKWTDLLGIETIKAVELSENDMINRFTQDCSYYIDSGSSIGCGWASTFRTASIDTSNTSGGGVVHFSSPQWTVPRYALPQTNGYNYSLLPYQVQFQVKIDYSSLWSFNEIYINSSAETGASYGAANSYDTGISFNFFPVFSDGESPTGAGGGLCTTNYSNNDSSSKYYTITCTVPSSAYTISDLRMTYNYNRTSTQAYPLSTTVGISTNFNFLFTGILEARQYLEGLKDNQAIIDIQTNQNETISILQDTNTTSDVNTADSFFSDTNSTSESAVADIVSTPLTLLNNLSTGTFNDICATLNNKQICLPSGDIIWNRQHGGTGVHDHWFRGGSTQAFITFFNLVVGGFILYKCLISLFHSVHKMLDPTQTYVEVMKL